MGGPPDRIGSPTVSSACRQARRRSQSHQQLQGNSDTLPHFHVDKALALLRAPLTSEAFTIIMASPFYLRPGTLGHNMGPAHPVHRHGATDAGQDQHRPREGEEEGALEREEIRARERARLSREDKGGRASLRNVEEYGFAAKVVDALNLRKALVDEKTTAKLKIAGYRNSRHLTLFLFARASLALAFLTIACFYIYGLGVLENQIFSVKLLIVAGVAYLGFYLPVMVVNNAAQKRQKLQSLQQIEYFQNST